MISKEITDHVLTIGTDYRPCKGGISVLLNGYSTFFEQFNFIKSSGKGNKLFKIFCFVQSLFLLSYKCLFHSEIKIVHIHTSTFTFLKREKWYVYISHFFGKKTIVHIHGGAFEVICKKYNKKLQNVYKKVDYVVCVSKYLEDLVKQYHIHNNTVVIPNFIEKSIIYQKEHETSSVVLSFLGTIDDNKGIFDVIDVMGKNQSYFRGKILFYIGGLGDEQRLTSLVQSYGIDDFVKYLGFVNGKNKTELLSNTDIYIQPSYVESFGISILEAMSYGAAVISSNVGGIPEVVGDNNGFLVSPGDKDALFEKLVLLLENPNMRKKFSENSIERSGQYYISEIENKIRCFYESIMKIYSNDEEIY